MRTMAPNSRLIRGTLLTAAAVALVAAAAMPLVHAQISMGAAQEVRVLGDGPLPPGFGGPAPAPMAGGCGAGGAHCACRAGH